MPEVAQRPPLRLSRGPKRNRVIGSPAGDDAEAVLVNVVAGEGVARA